MTRDGGPSGKDVAGEIDQEATLEDVISISEGDISKNYRVTKDGEAVGTLKMKDLVKALVPTKASDNGIRMKMSA